MAKDRDQQETLADLSPEESGWFSASLKHPEAKPEEVIEELREAIPIQMVHVAVAGAGLCPLDAMRCEASVRLRSYSRLIRARTRRDLPPTPAHVCSLGRTRRVADLPLPPSLDP